MICQHCHRRKATTTWVGDGGTLAWAHGFSEQWCEICCVEAQITHAKKIVGGLEKLEKKLVKLKKGELN